MEKVKAGLVVRDSLDVSRLIRDAREDGFRVFEIRHVAPSKSSLFDALERNLPMDPPLGPVNSWDALEDSLWEGLSIDPAEKILVIWEGCLDFARGLPKEFSTALDVFEGVASLPMERADSASPKVVAIYVIKS